LPQAGNTSSLTSANQTAPTVNDVSAIGVLANPVNRNLQITACYHELSSAFRNRTGGVANWCTFATWASKQAGVTIRGEDLARKMEEVLSTEPEIQAILALIKLHSMKLDSGSLNKDLHITALKKLTDTAKQRASTAVGRGNKKVFDEIALQFARFIATCVEDQEYKESSINDFCNQLNPGPPPDGQQHLAIAFRAYYKSFFETNPKVQDELILLANIQIGFHEQTRLQPEIAESLDAANIDPQQIRDYLTDLLVTSKSFKEKVIYFFKWLIGETRLFKNAIDNLAATAEKHIRAVITKHLMILTIPPDNILHLSEDLVYPFPENLSTISSPDLVNLLKQIRPTVDTIDGAGCTDWSNLKERIHFIAHLFRCYHSSRDLFDPPFTIEQLEVIKNGAVPDGPL
jgi:hypothetical protein